MNERKNPEEKPIDFLVEPLSDEELENVSGGGEAGPVTTCNTGTSCTTGTIATATDESA